MAAAPSSSNYVLRAYDLGGGAGSGSSASYQLKGAVGSNGGTLSSATYKLPVGVKASTTAATPPAPTFSNPDTGYDHLKLVLNVTGFPTDTKYLIAISSDGFATTKYVQTDQTIGNTLAIANYQTYASWGGASGFSVLGLTSGTTYQAKVAALQGGGTGSDFGPVASTSTVAPTVTLALSTSLTSTPPFAVGFSSLPANSVVSGDASIIATITTNAKNGGAILLRDQNTGLASSTKSYTVSSATADLAVATRGYGAQVSSVSQSSGGPLASASPFNGASNAVGGLTTSLQEVATFSSPINGGSLTFALKAKTDITVPSSADFVDALTLSISLLF
jgi:hypothetical protein